MRDPLTHVEKAPMPGFGQAAVRDLVASATGLVGNLPKSVGTGCGKRRPLMSTTTIPANVTCLACREWAHAEHVKWADMAEVAGDLAVTEAQRQTFRNNAAKHRDLAAQYGGI